MQLVLTEFRARQEQVLLSGEWHRAAAPQNSAALPGAGGKSAEGRARSPRMASPEAGRVRRHACTEADGRLWDIDRSHA